MKYTFTLFVLWFYIAGYAQLSLTSAPGCYSLQHPQSESISGNRDIIWMEDFANGITSGWTNLEVGGVASWEYRGLTTDPNVEVGTRGSCLPTGTLGDPILSPTAQNGFVIFDSNWWDNPNNPCSPDYYGTGPAPGPHLAILTSPVINLSANGSVALVFNQYRKSFTGQTRVEVTADGVNWYAVYIEDTTPATTLADDQQIVQISNFVAFQPSVQIRFVFEGFYYFWMLDDIMLVDALGNDLAIEHSTYGDFDLFDPSHPTGYEFMEYTKYPNSMAPNLKFSTMSENLGANAQNDCRLNVEVLDASNNILATNQSAEGFTVFPGLTQELRAGAFQMPAVNGTYRAVFHTSQTETDELPENNIDTLSFLINDVQYARDHLYTTAVYLGIPDYTDVQYELGNVFLVTADNLSCHSITVAVGIGSSTPANIYGALYSIDISTGINTQLIATTPSIALTQDMFNAYGDQILTNLTFDTPIPVSSGTAYFVAVGSVEGVDNFVCGLSGNAEEATAFVRYFPQDWYYLDRAPMIRMNFGIFDNVDNHELIQSTIQAYPVPANDVLHLNLGEWNGERVEIKIYDEMGRLIVSESNKSIQNSNASIDVKNMNPGIYELIVASDSKRGRTKFVKE